MAGDPPVARGEHLGIRSPAGLKFRASFARRTPGGLPPKAPAGADTVVQLRDVYGEGRIIELAASAPRRL